MAAKIGSCHNLVTAMPLTGQLIMIQGNFLLKCELYRVILYARKIATAIAKTSHLTVFACELNLRILT